MIFLFLITSLSISAFLYQGFDSMHKITNSKRDRVVSNVFAGIALVSMFAVLFWVE